MEHPADLVGRVVPWPEPVVRLNAGRPGDGVTSSRVVYVFSPAPHCPEWTAYTPLRWRDRLPSGRFFRGTAIVTARTLGHAKRAAIRHFKGVVGA